MQTTKRSAARRGTIVAVALAGSLLAGTTWASSRALEPDLKDRCINTLGAKPPVTEPGTERKPRCPTAVRYAPRTDRDRVAVEREEVVRRVVDQRA